MCRNVIRYADDEYSVVSSDYGLLPVPDYAVAITSINVVVDSVYDRYHQDPDPEFDECTTESCLNGGRIKAQSNSIKRSIFFRKTVRLYNA